MPGDTEVLRCTNNACQYSTPILAGGLRLLPDCPICGSEMRVTSAFEPPLA